MTQDQVRLEGKFNWNSPEIVTSFVRGEEAQAIYEAVRQFGSVGYDAQNQVMWGSNVPVSARIDTIMRSSGLGRVATLRDLSNPQVMSRVEGKFYTDTPAIVFRTLEDSYEPNRALIKDLIGHVEQAQSKLRLPVLVTGFDVAPADNKYGWTIVPRDDFSVVEDERLDGKYDGKSFNEVDENGLPNFDRKGDRTWYARNQGLSRLYLGGSLNVYSGDENLAVSNGGGRVVLVSGAATAPDLSRQYQAKLQDELKAQQSELDNWFKDSMANMPGDKK